MGCDDMTIEQIINSTKEVLTPSDICAILGCSSYAITLQAREDREHGVNSFPFPVLIIGTRPKIPRIPFIRAMGYDL
jgi:hypothetical protein